MRWKLLRRRLSISAPRVIVRSHLPWPLRWAVLALVLALVVGFSAATALWAFEFGREIAGLDRLSREELAALRAEVETLRAERDRVRASSNTVDSLLRAERAAQEKLAEQVRTLEAAQGELKDELAFFQRLLPAAGADGVSIRALQGDGGVAGQVRWRLLLMQTGRNVPPFKGRVELSLAGTTQEGRPWSQPAAAQALELKQVLRLEGALDHPASAVIKTITARVLDGAGAVRAAETAKVVAP